MAKSVSIASRMSAYSDLYIVFGVVLIIVMMILPLPPLMLDLLLAMNISLALLLLLLTMNISEPLELSVFPSLLLIVTLFRLSLNISSTRLILLQGNAGQIIQAFGNFVIGGNYVVGFVVFLILVIIQFIVITKGAERVAEVAARFTLDAMPGKQMSIDADLNSGLMTEAEAKEKRKQIEQEADFYGSMDGATKFVKGDAIAGIIITLINIVGGLAVGIGQRNLNFDQAIQSYTLLTVGDGLVTQIPALLVSTATGIIVTRAASTGSMGTDIVGQLFANAKVLIVAAVVFVIFGLTPGLPAFPFFTLATLAGATAYGIHRNQDQLASQAAAEEAQQQEDEGKKPEDLSSLLQVDPMELEIGYSLIPMVDAEQDGDLLERIAMIRKQCAVELGIVVPMVRIRDNLQVDSNSYFIKIKGNQVASGQLMLKHYLAMDAGGVEKPVEGIPTVEPAYGLEAMWVSSDNREQAEVAGYTVVDPQSVLATHLTEIIRNYAHELFGRQEAKSLLDNLKEDYPALIEELIPNLLSLSDVHKVLQNLLKASVPVRNMVTILEALADNASVSKDIDYLTEMVREALARTISSLYAEDGTISVLTLDRNWEELIATAVKESGGNGVFLDPRRLHKLYQALQESLEGVELMHPLLLVSPGIRLAVKRLTERAVPRLIVLSYNEIAPEYDVQAIEAVNWSDEG